MADDRSEIAGRCPACKGATLFVGVGGHVTCSRLDCPAPTAADDALHEDGYTFIREADLADVCARAGLAEERLTLARQALQLDRYFTADEVGADVAPRIIERLSELRGRAEKAEDRLAADQLKHRAERDIWKECDEKRWQQVRRAEAAVARIRAYIDQDFRFWCSPFGVAAQYANRLLAFIDRVND
ncbi:DUF6085 family protein [Nonomuraea mangrovi]|uniref:DUF6085 family protein n=1 Tax=Nonomuraea mangrovi TaxID=2316207 RepID=A0ABW4THA4_9ACTN